MTTQAQSDPRPHLWIGGKKYVFKEEDREKIKKLESVFPPPGSRSKLAAYFRKVGIGFRFFLRALNPRGL